MSRMIELIRFEMSQQARQKWVWLYVAVLTGFSMLAITRLVSGARGTLFDTPLAIAGATNLTTILGLFVTAAIAGAAATRDSSARVEPLVHTTPVSKNLYVASRFLGAWAFNSVLLLCAPAGIALATLMQGDASVLSLRPAAYLGAYATIAVPNAFIATALLFAAAASRRSVVPSYAGAFLIFGAILLIEGIIAEAMGRWELAKLLDPSGFVAVRELVRLWTAAEKELLLVPFGGSMLVNRVVWVGIGAAAVALACVRFRFAERPAGRWGRWRAARKARSREQAATSPASRVTRVAVPRVERGFGLAAHLRQTLAVARLSLRVLAGWRNLVLVALPSLFLLLFGPNLLRHLGTPLVPSTSRIVNILLGPDQLFLVFAAPFVIIVLAGELVWREREVRLDELAGTTPVPSWVSLAGRMLALGFTVLLIQAFTLVAAMLLQGGAPAEMTSPGLFVRALFGVQLVRYLLLAILALSVHVLVNQKAAAHLIVILGYAFTMLASEVGVQNNLLAYGSYGAWTYSDIRGGGPFPERLVLLQLYWSMWALLLGVAAHLFWTGGRESGTSARLRLARQRLTTAVASLLAAAMGGVFLLGGLYLYNTRVLNGYDSITERESARVLYEQRYRRYAGIPQPVLTASRLRVEIHPAARAMSISGDLVLINDGEAPVARIHVTTPWDAEVELPGPDRAAKAVVSDSVAGYHVFELEEALQPNESIRLPFVVRHATTGFPAGAIDPPVVENGTIIESHRWLPAVGYVDTRELQGTKRRAAHGLPERDALPALGDVRARYDRTAAERIMVDAVIGTSVDQTAVAPGTLKRSWTEGGRRYFHYVTASPIRNDYAFVSARYAGREAQWADGAGRNVSVELFHHPTHVHNVERMMRGAVASLEQYTRRFGPYPYEHLRFVERAGDGNGLHAAPINISYEEGFVLLDPERDPREIDLPFATVAHEVAHQWWGNQVTPAYMEGGAVMNEGLAWYSAMGVVETEYGPRHLERLLGMMREAYLTPRSRAGTPLLRGSDAFQSYRKGAFAMYALREYAGQERVDEALRSLLERHGSGQTPLPTTRELYAELKAALPPDLHPLLRDLFEVNTFWELSTSSAEAQPAGEGRWRVTLDVHARKVAVDTEGVETELPMNDLVEVGVFAAGTRGERGDPLAVQMRRIRSGAQRMVIEVAAKPASAGIDPRNLLIDVLPANNTREVTAPAP